MKHVLAIIVSMIMVLSTAANAEMIDNGDGTITDTVTEMVWESRSGYLKYEDACDYCDNLVSGGNDDWRLPNIEELATLPDYDLGVRAIPSVFPDNFTNLWSTTEVYTNRYRTLNKTGSISWADSYEKQMVKCVRGELISVSPAVVWGIPALTTHTLNSARYYCANLVEGGRDDWRLPTISELVWLIDWDAIDGHNGYNVWSGTLSGPAGNAWRVSFRDGSVISNTLINEAEVRCVCEGEVEIEETPEPEPVDVRTLIDEAGLALDGNGSIHAYPNTLNHHSLRYARFLNKKAGIKTKDITVPVLISGYVVDKLAALVYGEGVVDAYFLMNEKRFDIEPDFEGNYEGVVDIVGPHKMKDWIGLSWELELHSVDPEGTDAVVDVTTISVQNFKDKPWKAEKKAKKGKKCKK